jgi:DNA-binding transcriptional ArsR family regulator
MNESTRDRASQLFAALSNPSRLRIVELLSHQEMSVNQICDTLSLNQSATSQNLATLTRAGLLRVEQQGACRIYRIRGPRNARILTLIEEFCQWQELCDDSPLKQEGFTKEAGEG